MSGERMKWNFCKQQARQRDRESMGGEFFNDESIKNAASALVREGIQNSLDARRKQSDGKLSAASVRIFVSGRSGAVSAGQCGRYFAGAWEHFDARRDKLKRAPTPIDCCPYLVFEDFGTTGLTGDFRSNCLVPGQANPFYCFARAEGITDKAEGRGGSWGVGKLIFPRSSNARTVLFCTRRWDDQKVLTMGSMTLPSRTVGGANYTPDAWLGVVEGGDEAGIVLPSERPEDADEFSSTFGLKRGKEPGLSLVVPWYDEEDFTVNSLVEAVLHGWFYPILSGELSVTIESPSERVAINSASIAEHVETLHEKSQEALKNNIRLATAHISGTEEPISVQQLGGKGAPKWPESPVASSLIPELRQRIRDGKPVVFRVPVLVKPKNETPVIGEFDVCIIRDELAGKSAVTAVRQGILIPRAECAGSPKVRGLLVTTGGAMSQLLRRAEHPAHTHWNKDTGNFKDTYENGPSYLTVVKQAVQRLVAAVMEDEEMEDRGLLKDVFAVAAAPEPKAGPKPVPVRPQSSDPSSDSTLPEIPVKPGPGYRIDKTSDGFTVAAVSSDGRTPKRLAIRCGYNRRGGHPIKHWSKLDFEVNKSPIYTRTDMSGVDVSEQKDNVLKLEVKDPEFKFTLGGFDSKRDLVVQVQAQYAEDADAD
jgi:hypothetical protein